MTDSTRATAAHRNIPYDCCTCPDRLRAENERLRRALADIVNAKRDDGLAMRARAYAALEGEDGE